MIDASDHERIVREMKAYIAVFEGKNDRLPWAVWRNAIATRDQVIEKLKDAVFWFEVNSYDKRDAEKAGQFWREIRAIESAALTKQPEPKEGV